MHRNLEKKKTQNTSKGITLIALVITIIVLLILAGVAINMAIDSNGLFGKANEAVEGWNTAVENEQTAITDLLEKANSIGGTAGGGTEEPKDPEGPTDPEEPTQPEDPSSLPEGWDSAKVSAVVEEGTRKAPVPEGFVASQITAGEDGKGAENTISVGLVIYQGVDPVTGTAGSEAHNTAMTTRNQFVWIPVDDVNQMVMCKSNAKGSVCDLELVNGVLQCTNTAHTSTKTDLCGRLYTTYADISTTPYKTSMNFSDRTQTWTDNSGYREPDIVSDRDTDDTTGGLATFTTQMTNDFVNMATSVAKYGGFYVSRYEAGEKGASKKNQDVIMALGSNGTNYIGVNKWHGLYNAVKSSTALGETVVSTHMIYGSQYDQIINFIGSEAQTGHSDRQLTKLQKTGYANDKDIMKNIYDLEGNIFEWTAQAYDSSSRVIRGGVYDWAYNGFFYPSSEHVNYFPDSANYCTTRSSFYL